MKTIFSCLVSSMRELLIIIYVSGCYIFFSILSIFALIEFKLGGYEGNKFSVVNKININKKRCEKVGAFLYDREIDTLYLDVPWPFPVQLGISNGLTKCEMTPMFVRLPFLLKSWVNFEILLREIELLKLALTGKILMHSSCYDNTLVVGFPNSGKTYQTYKAVSEGAKLISEEYTIIYDGKAHPYERIMRTCFSARTMKDCNIETSLREKLWLAAATLRATLFPFMYEAVIWKNIPVSGESSEIKKIVYGSTGREVKNWKEFAILCENEFPFLSSEFLQAYALASGLDLIGIQETQRNLIKNFVESVYK